ncbi:glycosyltransferase [Actinomadura logoneensis]|uniref:Glycosyltransferase n=1 Tax=Actinomadura logoneensis TaxID=2293572 RepID=A0A372JFA1_9ACTN|nr:glycosyltransferase family 2 protein [Actinomadura logoneensis]RFU38579.1 glycosyltransferase [Actinomadura logoneensis]
MRYTLLVITRNRRPELLSTLGRLRALPGRPPIIVVDNASRDGSAEAASRLPGVTVVRAPRNLGAVARNVGVDHVRTPYVACCDDDTWWAPEAPERAARLLDAHPLLAAVTGRVLVGPDGREDPIVPELRDSPVPGPSWLPGPALGSFLAGATMLRAAAFRAAGGFSPKLWFGGEEELLAADLMASGWWLCYADDVIVHHEPSVVRDSGPRRRLGIRNTLWTTWLRRSTPDALRRTGALLRGVPRDLTTVGALAEAAAGIPWVLRNRAPVPPSVEARLRTLDEPQRRSPARRYVG